MSRYAGPFFIWLGAGHTLVGVVEGAGTLREIVAVGVVGGAAPAHLGSFAVFWFLCFGFLLMLLGGTLRWMQREHGVTTPRFVLLWSLLLAVLGVVLMPLSGFWLLLVGALAMLVARPRTGCRR